MKELDAVLALFPQLRRTELVSWIEVGWVRAESTGGGWRFEEVDVARVRLICELRHDCDVNDEALPLVLSLLDQVYALRGRLREVLRAVERQPEEVRATLLAALEAAEEGR